MGRAAARGWLAGMLMGVSAALLLGGCDRAPGASEAGAEGRPKRIVCMSPAMTQMVVDLGAGDRIVGVGSFDFAAPEGVAVVGHLRGLDYEKLIAARPTDIVLQVTREGVPDRLREMAESNGWRVWRWRLEDRASVVRTLYDADGAAGDGSGGVNDSIGGMLGDTEGARRLAASIDRRLDAIARLTAGADRPRVLVVVGSDPVVMGAGPGTYIDELLSIAGGANALTDSAVLYPELDYERLLALSPEVVLNIPARDPPPPLDLPAGLKSRVVTLADRRALLPSSTMPTIAAKMAKLLHPELAEAVDAAIGEGEAGERTDE